MSTYAESESLGYHLLNGFQSMMDRDYPETMPGSKEYKLIWQGFVMATALLVLRTKLDPHVVLAPLGVHMKEVELS